MNAEQKWMMFELSKRKRELKNRFRKLNWILDLSSYLDLGSWILFGSWILVLGS